MKYALLLLITLISNLKVSGTVFKFAFAGDFRGVYKEYPTKSNEFVGGVARVKGSLNGDANIFIYVGNIIKAHTDSNRKRVTLAKDILEKLKPSAVILGKNEFTMQPEDLDWFINNTANIVLSVNVEHKEKVIPANRIIKLGNIGIIIMGYTSEEVENLPGAANFRISNIIQSLNEKSRLVTYSYKYVRLFVAAGCTGIESAKEIAEGTNFINVIVSACSPTLLWHNSKELPENIYKYDNYPLKIKNKNGKDVLIVHTFGTTKFVGTLSLTLDNEGKIKGYKGEVEYLKSSISPNSEILNMVANEPSPPLMATGTIAKSRVFLDGTCNKAECNLGNLVADAFVNYKSSIYTGRFWTDTPIGLVAAGNIKADVNTTVHNGNVTAEDLSNAFPDIYELVTLKIKGKDLLKVLEYAIDFSSRDGGDKFLQLSGLRFIYDTRKRSGDRIVEVKIRCSECDVPSYSLLKEKNMYTLITTSNLQQGDFGHKILAEKSSIVMKHNITNWGAILKHINSTKLIGPANTDRIAQYPRHSSIKQWKSERILTFGMFSLVFLLYS